MSPASLLSIAAGAVFGAGIRWILGGYFAHVSASFAFGTLAANWIGALLIDICAELVQHPQWKLFLITGFLGSLTTFSAFSLEIVNLMQAQRWGAAFSTAALHVFGSLILTALGI